MKKIMRFISGTMAGVLIFTNIVCMLPIKASDVWPQKATAPFYCIDSGKGWQTVDRYDNYKFDTLPSPLNEVQAKRLFWAYPDVWKQLKTAAQISDPGLYQQIAQIVSDANVVKRVKDDASTKFAWVADHPDIEERAIAALEKAAAGSATSEKEAPEAIREATSEEKAVPFTVLPFSDGPNALDTEFKLSTEFVRDIARIEPQSVWDNGSSGGNVGWLDASQDKNIAKSVLGQNLYEVTWGGDSIKIHNNGSAVANENAVGSDMSDEVKYNKTTVRYKITMKEKSGWFTEGAWNNNYLHDWMDFKACVNAPDHQRLYNAKVMITPSQLTFYLVLSQGDSGTPAPDYGTQEPSVDFQIYRHKETFESNYNVRLKKMDSETGKPLQGSQFYLYERFDSAGEISDSQADAGIVEENLSFSPWDGFQIFSEGTTDENGVISYRDSRNYEYEKTYCDGHPAPNWAEIPEEEPDETTSEIKNASAIEETRDKNRAAAQVWLDLAAACEEEAGETATHFHWLADTGLTEEIESVLASGDPAGGGGAAAGKEKAFEESGCRADCEETYETFINLKFTYTWKEVQAKTGYILHGIHSDDLPVEMITTNSSEAGAKAGFAGGYSSDIKENVWYSGGGGGKAVKAGRQAENARLLYAGEAVKTGNLAANMGNAVPRVVSGVKTFAQDIFTLKLLTAASDSDAALFSSVATSNSVATPSNAAISSGREMSSSSAIYLHAATSSNASVASSSNAGEKYGSVNPSHAGYLKMISDIFSAQAARETADDSEWDSAGSDADFQSYLDSAGEDGIDHLTLGDSELYSHCGGKDPCGDSWQVFDHRTEGRLHINKRDLDLYRNENDDYSAYGGTEGDGSLEGAVYGLFAAEDILHPDTAVSADGSVKNTGVVFKRNDLAAVTTTDQNGDADFLAYTEQPDRTYDYMTGKIQKRTDIDWDGPGNLYQKEKFYPEIDDYTGDTGVARRYQNNEEKNGNCWIGRPLILGKYYIKELSRSEGYELSVNGITQENTNLGTGFETPEAIAAAHGTAVLSMPELSAAMEGDGGGGNGYNQFPFYVTSSGTADAISGTDGYDIVVSGFPEGTEFYRVDTGEEVVTGPHITGTEEVIVRDENGNTVWKRAESDSSNIRYRPVYGGNGTIISQEPVNREEPQILKAEQIPEMKAMQIRNMDIDMTDPFYQEAVKNYGFAGEQDQAFLFIKTRIEEILRANEYDVPRTAEGSHSTETVPVYSRGVRKGDADIYGQTTAVGAPAVRTVYGAAIADLEIMDPADSLTVIDLITAVLSWYNDHPEWSFGGIDRIEKITEGYKITLYAAVSNSSSRRFFTAREEGGKLVADKVYAVHENPHDLRWVYQKYSETGDYTFEAEKQYYIGSGNGKRYYMDAVLSPAMLVNDAGNLQEILHTVMVYHKKGEEIVDYLDGDPVHGFRVPLTETQDKVEITTELEPVETDMPLDAAYDRTAGTYTVHVKTSGTDHYGAAFSDSDGSLRLSFLAVTKQKKVTLTADDIADLGEANVFHYQEGDQIGYIQYLMLFKGASASVSVSAGAGAEDTYIVAKQLVYRGQDKVSEDGGSWKTPVQVLERPVKQKVKVVKDIDKDLFAAGFSAGAKTTAVRAVPNFRFRIYLKSNLERLWRNEAGEIFWQDKNGDPVEVSEYRAHFPELVQKIYTAEPDGAVRLLETVTTIFEDQDGQTRTEEHYQYEKFFSAVRTADTDKWKNAGEIFNSSFKPFVGNRLNGTANEINTSKEAKENARRSDAVRQFAIDWYLDAEAEKLLKMDPGGELRGENGSSIYSDELYDKALYAAVLKAEDYLKPFFLYDINAIYAIAWDSEEDGGIDKDKTTLAADTIVKEEGIPKYGYGISKYLPYGDYVLVEQQPWNPEWKDFINKHYAVDKPREISLPEAYEGGLAGIEEVPEVESDFYCYHASDTPDELADKYLIRFNEEMAENHSDDIRGYVIQCHGHDGDFEIYKYGLDVDQTSGHYEPYENQKVAEYYHYNAASEHAGTADQVPFMDETPGPEGSYGKHWKDGVKTMTGVRTAYDGKYASMLVPWSMTEPGDEAADCIQNADGTSSYLGYAYRRMHNIFYTVKLRVEKLDAETGEQILHDDAVFALYAAQRDESEDGDGIVKRYEKDTVISGSREFLQAMGAKNITPFAREWNSKQGPGKSYYGTVPIGTPICAETERILLTDRTGKQTGTFEAFSTVYDGDMKAEDGTGVEAGQLSGDGIGSRITKDGLQVTGYLETPQPVGTGVYVLAELKTPAGYARSKPVPVEIYSDEVSYYLDGGKEKTVSAVFSYPVISEKDGRISKYTGDTARIYVNDSAVSLKVSKMKTDDTVRKMKVSGRVEGSITELGGRYGLENLELAYNSSGAYLGYGWFKGTLEYLENRKAAGETVEIVYNEHHIFTGYGYVIRKLNTADDENRYVAGAKMALYDAIEIHPSGDTQDYAFEGVAVERDKNGNVLSITVQEGYAGEKTEFLQEDDTWTCKTIPRKDTQILFYDLGGLTVIKKDKDGRLTGYDREGKEQIITSDTRSVFALRSGIPVFEICGSQFDSLVYDKGARAFLTVPDSLTIYHLDEKLHRDSVVDGYTGLAYVEHEKGLFVWPVTVTKDSKGNVISRDKILTGRPAEIHADSENAYITGTFMDGKFEKQLEPVYDIHGLVRYYLRSGETYKKGEAVYDRDGDYVRYKYEDLLEEYNRAAYQIKEHGLLWNVGDPENPIDDEKLWHRSGEAYLIPNIWVSGETMPNDPGEDQVTFGQADMLKRVLPGTYIMEELEAPAGYVRTFPAAVNVAETAEIQKALIVNEKTKVEIVKVDAADSLRIPVIGSDGENYGYTVENKGAYTYEFIEGAELALFKAERIFTADYETYPKGYYLRKSELTPAKWILNDPVDNHPVEITAQWITDGTPKYFEGIPCGDYILEELTAPEGYLGASMEVTVEEKEELQSFVLKNDHTKLEIYKYEKDSSGGKRPLNNRHQAKLALYPAKTDETGQVVIENGVVLYDAKNQIDEWMTDDLSEYRPSMTEEFERLFKEYGDDLKEFSWFEGTEQSGKELSGTGKNIGEKTGVIDERAGRTGKERTAKCLESHASDGQESFTQVWETDSGKQIRITAYRNSGTAGTDENGLPEMQFEYQFNYKKGGDNGGRYSNMESYDLQSGRHRIDRIPEGFYVLVEEQVPDGYGKAENVLVTVSHTEALMRYEMENERRDVYIDKTDEKAKQVRGAKLALYRPDWDGNLTEAKEFLEDSWVSGSEGRYTADDRTEGKIPDGYTPGDFRPHRLPALAGGDYFLVETEAPEFYISMEPQKINLGKGPGIVVKAVNHLAKGQLIIEKQDATWEGKKLKGAVFGVENRKTGERFSMTTGEDGRAVLQDLDIGEMGPDGTVIPYEYRIWEITAPECYRLDFTERVFSFNGKNVSREITSFDGESTAKKVINYLLEIPNEETELVISKKDFESGHFVEGAVLAVYRAKLESGGFLPDGEPVDLWKSDGGSHRIIGRLAAGKLYLLTEEMAPDGYQKAEPVLFSVSEDGRKLQKISDSVQQIQIHFKENSDEILSISVTGCAAMETSYKLEKNNGTETWYEYTRFSDGSSRLTGKETFHAAEDDKSREWGRKREVVKTELILGSGADQREDAAQKEIAGERGNTDQKEIAGERENTDRKEIADQRENTDYKEEHENVTTQGINYGTGQGEEFVIESWEVKSGEEIKEIANREDNFAGELIFKPGRRYVLEERCHYSDGSILTITRNSFEIGLDGAAGFLELLDRPAEVYFKKTDFVTGSELPGAVLELRTEAGDFVERWITGEKEHRICGKMVPGQTYILTEIQAADGYAYAEEIRFTMNEDGCVERVTMEDRPTDVRIRKTDITTGEELPGAQMILMDQNGNVADRWISGIVPHEIKGKLIAGNIYVLSEETSPDGYACSENIVFTVSLDGKIDKVTMEDRPTHVIIHKSDLTTGTELPGARMTIKNKDGKVVERWISKAKPHEITAVLLAGETYLLCEEGAPDGFAYAADQNFTVSVDGTIDWIVMQDRPTVVEVEKQDGKTGELIGGAVLQILDADGNVIEEWVSKEGEPHRIEGILKAGASYVLKELHAPDGYKTAGDISFSVSLDGRQDKIVMTDLAAVPGHETEKETPPEICIHKFEKDTGEPLGGAEFSIWDEDGKFYLTVKTNAAGKAVFARPEAGTYTYQETKAPDGFLCSESIGTFTVTDSGKVKGIFSVYDEREPSEERRTGTITAEYTAGFGKKGMVRLDDQGRLRLRIPETGDNGNLVGDFFLMIFSAAAMVWLICKRGKKEK